MVIHKLTVADLMSTHIVYITLVSILGSLKSMVFKPVDLNSVVIAAKSMQLTLQVLSEQDSVYRYITLEIL